MVKKEHNNQQGAKFFFWQSPDAKFSAQPGLLVAQPCSPLKRLPEWETPE